MFEKIDFTAYNKIDTFEFEGRVYQIENRVIYNADRTVLIYCDPEKEGEFTAPEGLKKIGYKAFARTKLSYIVFKNGLESIGEKAFEGCMLQNVFVENAFTKILDNSFSQATYNHAMLYIPKDEWMEAVYHGDFWRFINIRETVTNTGNLSDTQAYTMMDRNTFGYMVYDAVNGTYIRANEQGRIIIPEGAVVVSGSRPVRKGPGAEDGIHIYTPVIVKYRNEKTEASIELEDLLR